MPSIVPSASHPVISFSTFALSSDPYFVATPYSCGLNESAMKLRPSVL